MPRTAERQIPDDFVLETSGDFIHRLRLQIEIDRVWRRTQIANAKSGAIVRAGRSVQLLTLKFLSVWMSPPPRER